MKFAEPTRPHRKPGVWGTRGSVEGIEFGGSVEGIEFGGSLEGRTLGSVGGQGLEARSRRIGGWGEFIWMRMLLLL
jgi:hypothetical protein